MEQLLRNFLNDNSTCIGLCDLDRKTTSINTLYAQQNAYKPQVNVSYTNVNMNQQMVQSQPKPQKQSLAQIFAAQQREYVAQQQKAYAQRQAYVEQQRSTFASAVQQQAAQQKVVQQKAVYTESKPVYANAVDYNQSLLNQMRKNSQSSVIVNGNSKKVISAAVPVRH